MARTPAEQLREFILIRNPQALQRKLKVLRVRMHPQVRVIGEHEILPGQSLELPIGDEHEIIIREVR
jgi:hypothetical protein